MEQKGKFKLFELEDFVDWMFELNVKREIRLIQNHHTWQPDYSAFKKLPDHFHWMTSMENYQMQNGFAEIAQQLTTFPDGKICVGRSFDVPPAGIKGANQFGVCIEHLGNFDKGGDLMTEDHRTTVTMLNITLCLKFDLEANVNTIVYHHWWDIVTGKRTNGTGNVKSCPGTNFFGGNSVQACEENFIPPISSVLKTLYEFEALNPPTRDATAGKAGTN